MEEALAWVAKVAAAVALGVPLVLYLLQDGMIFYPQPLAEARREEIGRRFPAVQEVVIQSADGGRLAWYVKPKQVAASALSPSCSISAAMRRRCRGCSSPPATRHPPDAAHRLPRLSGARSDGF